MYGWSRPGQGAGPILPVGGADFDGGPVFSAKTFPDADVTTPRHKCTRVLTIEEMLGFGHFYSTSYCEIFLSVVFFIEFVVDGVRCNAVTRHEKKK